MRKLIFWLLLIPGASYALDSQPQLQEDSIIPLDDVQLPELDSRVQTQVTDDMMDRSKDWLAGYINRLSGGIDTFFVDTFFSEEVLEDDVKGSRAKISFYSRREIGEPVDYKFGVSLRVALPNTNDRLNLLFQSEDEEDAREGDPLESLENAEYSTALRFIINESEKWKNNIDAGINWGVPPDPFVRFRARRYVYLSEWELKVTQSVFYFVEDGSGEETRFQADYPLNIEKLFRLNASAEYMKQDDYFTLKYGAGLYHELSRTRALAYTAGANGDTENGATFNAYSAGFRYRQLVYSDWVFAEINPEFIWTQDTDYETTPVIMLRFEGVISEQ